MKAKIQIKLKKPSVCTNVVPTTNANTNQPKTQVPTTNSDLKPKSAEQSHIIDLIKQNYNVSIDAVAGSGKTTTSLYIALDNPTANVLLLTYNARLKLETRHRVQVNNINNMEVHSYHSFCVKYFNRKAYTDSGIIAFIKTAKQCTNATKFNYNIIIIDEVQDMNPVYYELVQHILIRHTQTPQIVIMGDQKQSIYAFNNADPRYLRLAPLVFPNTRTWVNAQLNTSYRLTTPIAQFLNNCCAGTQQMNTIKLGEKVKYLICDPYGTHPYRELQRLLANGYQYDQIFILAPSVRSERSPVRHLANQLTQQHIPIYVPTDDNEKLDEEVLHGKIVFSTFHQVKGLERDVVILYNFDHSYTEYFEKKEINKLLPNTLYVGATRAKKYLVLIHDYEQNYLDCVDRFKIGTYCQLAIMNGLSLKPYRTRTHKCTEIKVTDLVKYVPVTVIDQCMQLIKVSVIQKPQDKLDIPFKTKQKDLYESVSEITGVAIPSYFEYLTTGQMTIHEHIKNNTIQQITTSLSQQPSHNIGRCLLGNSGDDISEDDDSEVLDENNICESLLQLSTQWVCEKSGYLFKNNQITDYSWLNQTELDESSQRLLKLIPDLHTENQLQFEKALIIKYNNYNIIGFADIYDTYNRNLYELKVVQELDNTHILQLVVYGWLIKRTIPNNPLNHMYLFNIMTNELRLIEVNFDLVDQIIDILINQKENGNDYINDQAFVSQCNKVRLV